MLEERSYLPDAKASLPSGPWLIVAPHPDDETFGLGGAILLAVEQGMAVDVLFLTSGDQDLREGLAETREQEALAAGKLLGLRNLSFWRLLDRSVGCYAPLIERLAQIISLERPANVFFPSPLEPHPDHRAAGVIAWEALRKTGFQAGPWSYEVAVQGPVSHLLDISRVASRKREIMAVYASQLAQNHYIERIMGLNQARAWSLPLEVSHAEGLYSWPRQDRPLNALLLEAQTRLLDIDALPPVAASVSVVIRTKNRPQLLREAIVSVAAQTYRDIELVVVNDGGSDVADLVGRYAVGSISNTVYERLEPGRGRAGAANAGLERAKGEYLLFLDDDDIISPDHVAKLASVLATNPDTVLAYSDCLMVDEDGQVVGRFEGEFKPYQLMAHNRIPIHAALFRRAVAAFGQCRFDAQFEVYEDWDFWLQLQTLGRFRHVPGMTARYRLHLFGGSGVHEIGDPHALEYRRIRDKWRGLWLDTWLVEAFEEAERVSVLEVRLAEKTDEADKASSCGIHADQQAKALRSKLEVCERELADTKSELQALLNSRSWRLSAVLRVAGNLFRRFFRRPDSVASVPYDAWIAAYDSLSGVQRQSIAEHIRQMSAPPLISILLPVYNAPLGFLKEAVDSVRAQLYPHWELCIADDASTDADLKTWLEHCADADSRIRVEFRAENGHISEASNTALAMAQGDFVALLDQDDVLPEHALYYVAKAIGEHPEAGIIYSDEDKLDEQGKRFGPYFKPDWNYELFLGQNLIGHLGVYRRSLLNEIGGFRSGFEGSQDHDLALRCVERLLPRQIVHIPRVLYHWRAHSDSTAASVEAKPYAVIAGVRAVTEHLGRSCPGAYAELIPEINHYRVHFPIPAPEPRVTVIIPTRNRLDLLKPCITSILSKTSYRNYEILVVDNHSDEEEVLAYLRELERDGSVRVLRDERPFNYSALMNAAVAKTNAEFLLLLNNDVAVISENWMGEMVAVAVRPGVGAVGARLWYADDTLQHGGVLLGVGGVAAHAHCRLKRGESGYFCRAALTQSMSAVTAACLLVRREIYQQVGGFDEENLTIAFNDVDFCLKVREAGYRNVWTPWAELYHYESATRGSDMLPEKYERFQNEIAFMRKKWGSLLETDPAYNPNLSLRSEDYVIAETPRLPPLG